nr:hypothetical protein [Tanacetum cinerariifolium]
CKRGVGRKLRGWWCDAYEKAVEYPVLRLELGISNVIAHVVVVMFDETASELVKCLADSLAQSNDEYLYDTSGLLDTLANIIGTTHTLEMESYTYYEHETFKSFTCWNLIPPKDTEWVELPNVRRGNCKRGVGRKLRGWWCDAYEKAVEYPVLRVVVLLACNAFDMQGLWSGFNIVLQMVGPLERPLVLPPPLPARPPVPPPHDAAAGRPALWVVILGGIHEGEHG